MADRWTHVARLLALHGEASAALALLRCRLQGLEKGRLDEVAARMRELARHLEALTKARGAPRTLRLAARRHVASVAQLLS
jgi:hypothetical protein